MPIKFKEEPAEIKAVVKARIGDLTAKKAFRTPILAKSMQEKAPRTPEITQAIPMYSIGLKDLSKAVDLSSADQKSWRYLIKQGGTVVATADAIHGPEKKAMFSDINEGHLVNGLASAIQAANNNEQVKTGQFEARLLTIPALYFAALWLTDPTNKTDLIMPIDPGPTRFSANKVVPLKELLPALQQQAKAALAAQGTDEAIVG